MFFEHWQGNMVVRAGLGLAIAPNMVGVSNTFVSPTPSLFPFLITFSSASPLLSTARAHPHWAAPLLLPKSPREGYRLKTKMRALGPGIVDEARTLS